MAAGFGPIAGLKIGHASTALGTSAQDTSTALGASLPALTGCTVLLAEAGMVAACDMRGGAVGERELATLQPGHLVERIHALVLAGGSAFGLEAAAGVMRWCEERGIGFDTGVARVPIVPAAILFDLRLGEVSPAAAGPETGQPARSPRPRHPDAAMGYAAAEAAAQSRPDARVAEGNVGAGTGATVGKLFGIARATKAGIGCWTEELPGGVRVAALTAVNAFGDIRDPDTGRILAGARASATRSRGSSARLRRAGAHKFVDTAAAMRHGTIRKGFADPSTVLVAVATSAALSRLEAQRLAVMATAGMSRVVSPAHTTFDGDVVFALSVGNAPADVNALGAAAAEAVARAIVRGVTQARSAGGVLAAGS